LNICNLNSCKTVSSSTIKNKKSKFQTIFSKLEDTQTNFIAIPLPELTIFLYFLCFSSIFHDMIGICATCKFKQMINHATSFICYRSCRGTFLSFVIFVDLFNFFFVFLKYFSVLVVHTCMFPILL
jgi:hypothetical protein